MITLKWPGIDNPEETFYVELDRIEEGLIGMTLTDPDDQFYWELLDEEVDDLIKALKDIRNADRE